MLLPMSNAVLIPVQFRLDWRSFVMVNHDLFRFSTSLGFIAKVWLNKFYSQIKIITFNCKYNYHS